MEKKGWILVVFFVLIGMLQACSEVKTDVKKLEGKWNIIEVKGKKLLMEGLPSMEFDMQEGKIYGNAGCNLFNSTIELNADDVSLITINPGATTMMACPDMETEDAILKAMNDVKRVKSGHSEDEMLLIDSNGNVVFVLSKGK